MWFTNIAEAEYPDLKDLHNFVHRTSKFLGSVVESPDFDWLFWWHDPSLREDARGTFLEDVRSSADTLLEHLASGNIDRKRFESHGLFGRPLRFKLRVLESIDRLWDRFFGRLAQMRGRWNIWDQLRMRDWFKSMTDAIDAILDSLIDAAGGIGALIKEFKDALAALAQSVV